MLRLSTLLPSDKWLRAGVKRRLQIIVIIDKTIERQYRCMLNREIVGDK